MINQMFRAGHIAAFCVSGAMCLAPAIARAHCDSLDGPVVLTARAALDQGDVTQVLKWVHPENEAAIREAFYKALTVRSKGADARELADNYFFETLVRLHRAGEGAPYTGLKPAGSAEPGIQMADRALASGSDVQLLEEMKTHLAAGIHERFAEAVEAKKHADESVEAGRRFVRAYVELIHYVENIRSTMSASGHGAEHHE